uniref:Uncharacterized protein n=1 Tax=Tanacetum cinerariifolium TaxID=118510 RepID=A0A6L2MHR9_TANCI|nr:hypothetical protein [Tanacetum cinerariifolium]
MKPFPNVEEAFVVIRQEDSRKSVMPGKEEENFVAMTINSQPKYKPRGLNAGPWRARVVQRIEEKETTWCRTQHEQGNNGIKQFTFQTVASCSKAEKKKERLDFKSENDYKLEKGVVAVNILGGNNVDDEEIIGRGGKRDRLYHLKDVKSSVNLVKEVSNNKNKSHRASYPSSMNKTNTPFDLVHSDVWGPSPGMDHTGKDIDAITLLLGKWILSQNSEEINKDDGKVSHGTQDQLISQQEEVTIEHTTTLDNGVFINISHVKIESDQEDEPMIQSPTTPPDHTPEDAHEVSNSESDNSVEDNVFRLPFRKNRGRPPSRYSPEESKRREASALASNYSPPPKDSLLAQTGDITMFIDCVDDSILSHNVSKPLPLGGPPGKVTIQSDFFFNKDLEYLRYGSKGSRLALSISKMKAAYYSNVGLEQIVPDQMWIEEECKYDIAAMYGISHWWFQRQRFYIDRHTSEGDCRAVMTHMRILSVVRIEVFSMYGYNYTKKIVLWSLEPPTTQRQEDSYYCRQLMDQTFGYPTKSRRLSARD